MALLGFEEINLRVKDLNREFNLFHQSEILFADQRSLNLQTSTHFGYFIHLVQWSYTLFNEDSSKINISFLRDIYIDELDLDSSLRLQNFKKQINHLRLYLSHNLVEKKMKKVNYLLDVFFESNFNFNRPIREEDYEKINQYLNQSILLLFGHLKRKINHITNDEFKDLFIAKLNEAHRTLNNDIIRSTLLEIIESSRDFSYIDVNKFYQSNLESWKKKLKVVKRGALLPTLKKVINEDLKLSL